MRDQKTNLSRLRLFLWCLILSGLVYSAVSMYLLAKRQTEKGATVAHARQIHLALMEYALDHDGQFPASDTDSNAAFRQLFDDRFQEERIFFVGGSAWHDSLPAGRARPDNEVGDPPEYRKGLEQGENHWAYQSGLNHESQGNLPLIMDGFSDQVGVYANDPAKRGGTWNGKAAVVVRVDGASSMHRYSGDGRVYEPVEAGKVVDIFSSQFGTDPVKLLNPW